MFWISPGICLLWCGEVRGQGLHACPALMGPGPQDCVRPIRAPEGHKAESRDTGQDSLLAEDPLVSTEVIHEVGGDTAEVDGQDVPVIVGVRGP